MRAWILSSSVLILAVLLLRWVLRGKVNPRTQYALWLLVLVRLVLPFSLFSSGLSIQNVSDQLLDRPEIQQFYEKTDTPVLPEEDPGELPGIPDGQATDDPVIRPQQNPVFVPQDRNPQQNPAVSQNDSQQLPQIPETPVQTEPVSLGAVLFRVWIGGMGLMALWMIGCNVHFAAGLRKSRRRLDIPQSPIEVYITKKVETPCLFGLFSPAVYLTPEAAEDRQAMGYVLTHELTHYRQFDHVWSLLRGVCLVIHWYNPLVWVAFRASRQDCEMACDEGTLKQLGEAHRGDYGRTLIALATQTRLRGTMLAATTMADGKKAIKERIVILMKNPKTALITMVTLILICALIVGCTFTGPVEGNEPGETTPIETTQPEETTQPAETTRPTDPSGHTPTPDMSEDSRDLPIPDEPDGVPETDEEYTAYLEQWGFEPHRGIGHEGYRYTGEKDAVFMEDLGLTLTIPKEWSDQVEIIYAGGLMSSGYSVYVVNRRLAEEYHGQLTSMAYVFRIWATRKTASNDGNPRTDTDGRLYLGENNEFFFYGNTAEMTGGMDTPMFWKGFILREKGQDYYDDLVGDLILDPERIPGLVSIQDTPEAFVEEKPPATLADHPDFTWTGHRWIYRYTGTSSVIPFPEYGFTLNLPDGWLEQIDVIFREDDYGGFDLFLMNREMVQMFFDQNILNPYLEPYMTDYILHIYNDEGPLTRFLWILGETEEYTIAAYSREMDREDPHSGIPMGEFSAIERIGEAAYRDMQDDFVVTDEMINQLVVRDDGESVTLCLTRDQIERYYGSDDVSAMYYMIDYGEVNVLPELINPFPNLKRLYVDAEFGLQDHDKLALDFSELNIPEENIDVMDEYW